MNRSQFDLSLSHAKPSDWAHFEALCSSFLASDHPSMRTMATPSGDGGRDSQLYNPDGNNIVCAQYSVTEAWETKIKATKKRLLENFGSVKILIYMSNQEIGAKGDNVKSVLQKDGIFLDIRDKNWFLDRFSADEQKTSGAEEFFERIGRPYLEGQKVIETKRSALSNQEAKAALVYLGMQWEDANTDKGLTKLSYEGLVRSVLRKTSASNLMSRAEIHTALHSLLPSQSRETIEKFANAALNRLNKDIVKKQGDKDLFHLAHGEHLRLNEKLIEQDLQDLALDQEILVNVKIYSESIPDDITKIFAKITKQVLDLSLLKAGENFSASVLAGVIHKLDRNMVHALIIEKIAEQGSNLAAWADKSCQIVTAALDDTIKSRNEAVRRHLKTLSDTYTLFAFLRETPDVQKATKKIFSFGKIWLDTTLILPLLADQLKDDESNKRFSYIVKNLVASGVEIFLSEAAVNEVLNHIRISLACANRGTQWEGRIPYLYSQYIQDGRNRSLFADWATKFRGCERPDLDIKEFLLNEYGVKYADLSDDYSRSDEELRFSVDRLWREAHNTRRGNMKVIGESDTLDILIRNDVVSYLGIIERRKKENSVELGYQHWWLTIDSTAWTIRESLAKEFPTPPSSPLMSLDFIVQNMSFGPIKNQLSRSAEQLLPILLDLEIAQVVPPEVLKFADDVRSQNEGQPEYVIRRKVRDACDRARRQVGDYTNGFSSIE